MAECNVMAYGRFIGAGFLAKAGERREIFPYVSDILRMRDDRDGSHAVSLARFRFAPRRNDAERLQHRFTLRSDA